MPQVRSVVALEFLANRKAIAFQWSDEELDLLCYALNCDKIKYRFISLPAPRGIPRLSANGIEIICKLLGLNNKRFMINYQSRIGHNSFCEDEVYYGSDYDDITYEYSKSNEDIYLRTVYEDRAEFVNYYEMLREREDG